MEEAAKIVFIVFIFFVFLVGIVFPILAHTSAKFSKWLERVWP